MNKRIRRANGTPEAVSICVGLLSALATAMLASPASAGDDFFIVDNSTDRLYRSNTDNVPGEVLIAILPPAFWAELSPSDQPGHLFAARPDLGDIVKLSEIDGAIVETIVPDEVIRNLGYDGSSGVLYGLPQQGSIDLLIIDTDTGITTNLGFTGIPGDTIDVFGMAFDPLSNLLYVTDVQENLYAIDPADASSVLIGRMGIVHPFAIAYNPRDGQLYVTDAVTDSLYTVDRTTAMTTLVGGPYTNAHLATGLSFGTGCLSDISEEIICHENGTTFTVNIEGVNACTGGTSMFTFTASGGVVGGELCFTVLVDDGGFCCSTEICVTIPDCPHPCAIDVNQPSNEVCVAFFEQPDHAQSFRPNLNHIVGAGVFLRADQEGSGNVTIELWDELPNAGGVLITSGTQFGSAGEWVDVHWPPVPVTVGDEYSLVLLGDNNGLCVAGDTTNPYPDGILYGNLGYQPFPEFDHTFRTCGFDATEPCDLDGDGIVGITDFLWLLAAWGPCDDCDHCPADLDNDCTVGVTDFLLLLASWTP